MSSTFYIPWTLTNHVDINLFCLYSYSTSYIGPVGVLCFFLVATVINKVLMSPVVNFVFKRQEMEGNYRQGQMFDVSCEFQRHMYTVNRKIFTRILFFPPFALIVCVQILNLMNCSFLMLLNTGRYTAILGGILDREKQFPCVKKTKVTMKN